MKKNLFKLFLIAFLIITPVLSFASDGVTPSGHVGTPGSTSGGKILNPLGEGGPDTIPAFIKILLKGVLQIGMPIVALAVIYCGFLFVSARGNSEKLTKAKDALLYTLIGAAILLGSWAIAQIISETALTFYK